MQFLLWTALLIVAAPGYGGVSPETINNPAQGKWNQQGRSLELVRDLTIGTDEGPVVFGVPLAIAVNSKYQIAVLDKGFQALSLFDSVGSFVETIGSYGPGPGEFARPTAMAYDSEDSLYVADGRRVLVFCPTGAFVREFSVEGTVPGLSVRSIKIDRQHNIYLAQLNQRTHRVIHKYTWSDQRSQSFCSSAEVASTNIILERFTDGPIDVDERGYVYFSRQMPYEIRVFSSDGELTAIVTKEHNFPKLKDAIEFGDGNLIIRRTPKVLNVLALNGLLLHHVRVAYKDSEPTTLLDLFDNTGQLLLSQEYDYEFRPLARDDQGRVYIVDNRGHPKIVRCQLEY